MNPETLQYFMGHSDLLVTMNVCKHTGFDDADEELNLMEEFRKAQAEIEKKNEKLMSQKMVERIQYGRSMMLRLVWGIIFYGKYVKKTI